MRRIVGTHHAHVAHDVTRYVTFDLCVYMSTHTSLCSSPQLKRRVERHYPRLQQAKASTSSLSHLSDTLVAIALIASLALILDHKIMKQRVWFMTQPCYALHTLVSNTCATRANSVQDTRM